MNKSSRPSQSAVKRLQRDYLEWKESARHFVNIGAEPLETNIFLWHFNVVVGGEVALHGEIRFPASYPFQPPKVSFFGNVPHRQISRLGGFESVAPLCLDMLQKKSNGYYQGWSSAYSVVSIFAQMETLLHRLGKNQLDRRWKDFRCSLCGHDGVDPQEFYPSPHVPPSFRCIPRSCSSSNESPVWHLLNPDVEGEIFSYLMQNDLQRLTLVNSHLQAVVCNSQIFYQRMVQCYHSHANFGAFLDSRRNWRMHQKNDASIVRQNLFGIGFSSEHWENEKREGKVDTVLKDLNICPDVLSYRAFCDGVRFSMWRDVKFEDFLPLYLNNQHGEFALHLAERVIHKVYNVRHDSSSSSSHRFDPILALKFLSKMMNTTVVRLMREVEETLSSTENGGVPLFTSIKALQCYMYCYHLLLGFCRKYPTILEYARRKVHEFVFAGHRRDKKNFPDMGELIIYLTIVPISWSTFGPVLVDEALCRNAKWILKEHPSLITTDKNIGVSCVRLRKSWRTTIVGKRLQMFQYYFLESICGVGKSSVLFDLDSKLVEMNKCLGQVRQSVAIELQKRCRVIFRVDDWLDYFQMIGLPCPSARRLSHDLREAMLESDRKGYHRFVDTPVGEEQLHEDPDLCMCSGDVLSVASREQELQERDDDAEEDEKAREGENETRNLKAEGRRKHLDVAFSVDCTGSMSSYLNSVKVHIANIARELSEEEQVDVRFAMVGYRDHGGERGGWMDVTKVADFQCLKEFERSLRGYTVGGGCDVEAVADAWHDILGLNWRRFSVKAVIQVADIGCHGLSSDHDECSNGYDPIVLAREMLERDITLYNVGCTMRGGDSEHFFRGTAHMTGGLYLTLDSAQNLPRVIIESTREGISLTRVIPLVFELMSKFRQENVSATRDQIAYFVWRELVQKKISTEKVECVDINASKLTDCVLEISEAKSLAEVRDILRKHGISRNSRTTSYSGRNRVPAAYNRGKNNEEIGTAKKHVMGDGRLISLEQTLRCMNRAEQIGKRTQWLKNGCVYRGSEYLRGPSEARFVEYGVAYKSRMSRIRRHAFEIGTVVELNDWKTHKIYCGPVVDVDEENFRMTIRASGLGQRTVQLTSRNVSKFGKHLEYKPIIGVNDPIFVEMERRFKKWENDEARKFAQKKKAREEARRRKQKKEAEMIERRRRGEEKMISSSSSFAGLVQEQKQEEEEHEEVEVAAASRSRDVVIPRCVPSDLTDDHMVMRSMLSVVVPKELWGPIQAIRRIHDRAYSRWMPQVTVLHPFVARSLFEDDGKNLEAAFRSRRMEPFEFELVGFEFEDEQPTYRDVDPLVFVYLRTRVVSGNGWQELLDCVGSMYPKSDQVRVQKQKNNPHVVVARIARSRAKKLVLDLEVEWKQRNLFPMRFAVDSVSFCSRTRSGRAATFGVNRVAKFVLC